MVNKSYIKGYNFQQRVKKYLEKKGFITVVRPRSKFPDITAYTRMGSQVSTVITHSDKQIKLNVDPFIVFDIECKVNGYLNKTEKEKALQRLKEGKCNAFFVAYRKKRKLQFKGIWLNSKNEEYSRYIG